MNRCECGSYAINPNLFPRTGKYLELCDVCYFKKAMKLFEDTGLDNLLWTLLDTITKGE